MENPPVITSGAKLLAYPELNGALELMAVADGMLTDARIGKNDGHAIADVATVVVRSARWYEDVNDSERLPHDKLSGVCVRNAIYGAWRLRGGPSGFHRTGELQREEAKRRQ